MEAGLKRRFHCHLLLISMARSLLWSLVRRRYTFFAIIRRDRSFILFLAFCFFLVGAVYPEAEIARWVGFALAGYSAIANDSIQTVGTFIASNRQRPWWLLWLFIGGLFVATVTVSWLSFDGDVSYQRLSAKGFAEAPSQFTFLQVAAPLFLLVLTRLRMPVSTTFLLLSCFSTDLGGLEKMLIKSVAGYGVAFVGAFLAWTVLARTVRFRGAPHPVWVPLQWSSTGLLWCSWIMQDAANIAVYLPRRLDALEFLIFAGFVFAGLGLLFYLKGDRIQNVVTEKTDVTDIRAATLIDFVYAALLFGFTAISVIPMSTTWLFIGLLGGREVAFSLSARGANRPPLAESFRLMRKDLAYAGIGLVVSIALALAAQPGLRQAVLDFF